MSSSSGTQFLLIQPIKKDLNSCFCQEKLRCQGQSQNTPATGVNAIAIRKNKNKNKDKKDLANIECYNYKQKGYYVNKYLEINPKN